MERVVVTGMGLVSCIGSELDEVSTALREGRGGVVLNEERKSMGFRSGLSTLLPEIDIKAELSRSVRRYMPGAALYAALASNRAMASGRIERATLARPDVGIIVGNDSSVEPIPDMLKTVEKHGETRFLGSTAIIKSMTSTASMNLGPYLGAQGINMSISSACSSGANAIGLAYQQIRAGAQRMIFAGGTQEDSWLAAAAFDAINALSIRQDDPAGAVRPFDAGRDGLVPGMGGAMLVLESLTSARRREAPVFGEVIGYGYSSDGGHLTLPTGVGAVRSMANALTDAGVEHPEIDYINAHATGTVQGDRAEAGAIREIFGEQGPPVSSTKALTGHECWMCGASEAIYSLLMMRDRFLAGNRNFEGFDDETPRIAVLPESIEAEPRTIMSNSFGFGGTNATLVLRRWDD